jgi:hypothetical protein
MTLNSRAKLVSHWSYILLGLFSFALFFVGSNTASALVLATTPQPTATLSFGQTIVAEDFTIDYPDGFSATTAGVSVIIGSSQAAIDQIYKSDPKLTSVSAVVEIYYILGGDLAAAGLNENASEVLLKGFAQKNSMNLEAITHFKLGEIEGAQAIRHEKTFDGIVMSFVLNRAFFFAVLTTASNEVAEYEAFLDGVVQSIRPTPLSLLTPLISPADMVKLDKSFVSRDQQVSFDYPAGWIIEDQSDTANQINLASSQDAFNTFNKSSTSQLTSGQIAIQFYYGSVVSVMTLDSDGTAENLIRKFAEADSLTSANIQSFKLGQYHAARIEFGYANFSGVFIGVVDGQTPILAGIFTAPHELAKVEPILDAIVLSALEKGANAVINSFIPVATPTVSDLANGLALDETFISSDKSLRVNYPSRWITHALNASQVVIANSAKAVDELNNSSSSGLSSGSMGVEFSYASVDNLPPAADAGGDPLKLLQNLTAKLPSAIKVGEVEAYTLGSLKTARVKMAAQGTELITYVFYVDRNVVIVAASAATGELAQFLPTLEAMILSVRVDPPA